MKDAVIKLCGKLVWILGMASMVGGGGLLAFSVLVLIAAIFIKDGGSAAIAAIVLGAVGLSGIPLGRWLLRKHHELAESLWAYGEKAPYSGVRLMMKLEAASEAQKLKTMQRQSLLDGIAARSGGPEIKVIAQGGAGWAHLSGKSLLLSLSNDSLHLADLDGIDEHSITFNQVTDITIGGPGTITKGGGAVGGGFGVEGFLVGAAAASLINLLTTHTTTKTLVKISTNGTELFLLSSNLDPDGMRLYLSPVFAQLSATERDNQKTAASVGLADELLKLSELRKAGTINDDEFSLLKGQLLQRGQI